MKIRRGKDWIDEGPTPHHGIKGYTSGGEPVNRAMPVLTAAIPKSPSRKRREAEQKKLKRSGGWSSKPIKRSVTAAQRFELHRGVDETQGNSKGNQNTAA